MCASNANPGGNDNIVGCQSWYYRPWGHEDHDQRWTDVDGSKDFAGESGVGEYPDTRTEGCCGDDANEYYAPLCPGVTGTRKCCSSQDAKIDANGNCVVSCPCLILSATFTLSDTNRNGRADRNEMVTLSGIAAGDCSNAKVFQIDASIVGCNVEFSGGDISGFTTSVTGLGSSGTSAFTGTWRVPSSIPSNCRYKPVTATASGLWAGNPAASDEIAIGTATGFLIFGT